MNGAIYTVDIDYGSGMTHFMDFDPNDPNEDLRTPAGELLRLLLQLNPKGISLEINMKAGQDQ